MLLKKGSKGQSVKELQEALGIGADGIFGSGTEAAVKKFQKENPNIYKILQAGDLIGLAKGRAPSKVISALSSAFGRSSEQLKQIPDKESQNEKE